MDNQVTPVMIKRFLNHELVGAEAALVAAYLHQHPELLERYCQDDDLWRQDYPVLPAKLSKEIWQIVSKNTRPRYYLRRLIIAAASIIIVIIGIGYLLLASTKVTNTQRQITRVEKKEMHVIENTKDILKTVYLPDSTMVQMSPSALLIYYGSFAENRSVCLKGKADFAVRHDTRHPFTVYCDSVGTTALGTRFIMNSDHAGKITVHLIEGKVLVRSQNHHLVLKPVYLNPGQKLYIDRRTGRITIKDLNAKASSATAPKQAPALEKKGQTVWTNSAYQFSQASLGKVFKELEFRYHVTIKFNNTDVKGTQFTGKILYNDSLQTILSAICQINNLQYVKSGPIIRISKK